MFHSNEDSSAWMGQFEYVVANSTNRVPGYEHSDYADNPCQTASEEDCAAWLQERLMALYND